MLTGLVFGLMCGLIGIIFAILRFIVKKIKENI